MDILLNIASLSHGLDEESGALVRPPAADDVVAEVEAVEGGARHLVLALGAVRLEVARQGLEIFRD